MLLILTNVALTIFGLINLWLVWKVHNLSEALEAIAIRTVLLSNMSGKSNRELNEATLAMLQENED